MKIYTKLLFSTCLIGLLLVSYVNAQVTVTPATSTICPGQSVTLNATGQTGGPNGTGIQTNACTAAGTQVNGLTDDNVQGPFNIGFNFCFYGNNYNQFYVCSNNWMGFSGGQTGTWQTAPIPSVANTVPKNCIMAPWQDINPGLGGTVRWKLIGTAPNRMLTVSWCQIPMFSCTGLLYSSQIIIHETTNIIETHILNRPLCLNWNNGNATHGLHNANGTQATVVPGRNNTAWTAANDGKRFIPNGPGTGCGQTTSYIIEDIPYNPQYGNPPGPITWFEMPDLTTPIGTGNSITVTPTNATTIYRASQNPNGIAPFGEATVNWDIQNVNFLVDDFDCFGSPTGASISASVANFGPWSYVWTDISGVPVSSQNNVNGPGVYVPPNEGSYIVTVTDNLGCTHTDTATIVEPDLLQIQLTSLDSMLCFGDNQANFSVLASGGTPPYNYTSNPPLLGANGNFVSNAGGNFEVTVTDANNCTSAINVSVYQEQVPFTILVDTIQQIPCFGLNNGQIIIIPVGGLAPYSFTVAQNPALNNSSGQFINLPPGQYTITCSDSYGCSYVVEATISQPANPLSANIISQTPVRCFGEGNGRIIIAAQGGTPPYQFGNSVNTLFTNPAIFDDLFAGPDQFLVVDANGCNVTVPYVMTQPNQELTVSINNFQNVLCLPTIDGSISLTVSGGTPYIDNIYRHALLMQQPNLDYDTVEVNFTGVFGNLNSGAYYIIISDAAGCTQTVVFDITAPTHPLGLNVVIHTDNICYGGNIGRLFFEATGGTPSYQYLVNSSVVTNNDVNNLIAGSYLLTVIDSNGCQKDTIVPILEPPFYQLQFVNIDSVYCFGDCNGTVQVNAIGGTPNYTYQINGVTSNNTGLFENLCSEPFTITVTDGNGCTLTGNNEVLQPEAPLDAIVVLNDSVTCFGGNNGMFYIQAIGGSPNYTYSMVGQTNGVTETNQNGVFTGLTADDYDVTITDSKNCTILRTVNIGQPEIPMTLSISGITNVLCHGDTTGKICFNIIGGTAPYTYFCQDDALVAPEGLLATGNTCFWGLNAGTYTITVTDSRGCSASLTATITQPANPLSASSVQTDVTCFGGSNGSAAITAIGGTVPYEYAINTNPFVYTAVFAFNQLSSGNYSVIVRDANLCTTTVPFFINQPEFPLAAETVNIETLRCFGDSNACVQIAGIATTGTAPYTYSYNNSTNTTGIFCGFPAGIYSFIVTDANNCTLVHQVNIEAPQPVEAVIVSSIPVSCFGGSNGRLKAAGVGGTPGQNPAYFFEWLGLPSQADSVVNLSATTYCVVVRDSLGCRDTACATITQPEQLLAAGVGEKNICIGDSTTLTMNATGGTPDYTFTWLPNGVMQTPPLTGSQIVVNPTTTTYYVIDVRDSRGCRAPRDTFNVVIHPLPTANFVAEDKFICEGECTPFTDISLISSTTGDSLVNWTWWFGDNTFRSEFNPTQCYNTPGNKTVKLVVETNIGCKDTIEIANAVVVYPKPTIKFDFSPSPATLLEPTITFNHFQPEGNTYSWTFGDGNNFNGINPVHTYNDTGWYKVVLTQTTDKGCIDSLAQYVRIDPDVTLFVPNAFTPNGDRINDTFLVIGQYIKEYNLIIFDRWGQQVFASDSLSSVWDGTKEGQQMYIGTYSWQIRAVDSFGNRIRKNGQVSLIR